MTASGYSAGRLFQGGKAEGTLSAAKGNLPERFHGEWQMATGWAGDNAVQDQIADSLADEIARVRSRLPQGESLAECEGCGGPIPESRRKALPGVRLCLSCQEERDREQAAFSPYNRKGSKYSQLR
jgi:phage/conjugal plasmid C-4 type zinc finger TraR family protein